MPEQTDSFAEWAVLELMGHRRLGGFVREVNIGGASFLRIDVPAADGQPVATQYYSPSAVYCITPTTEEMARAVAVANKPEPVTRFELKQLTAAVKPVAGLAPEGDIEIPDDIDEEAPF